MSGTQSLIGGGDVPGLALVAWALIDGGGAIIKSMNVASVQRIGLGQYRLNYSQARAHTNQFAVIKTADALGQGYPLRLVTPTYNTANCVFSINQNASLADIVSNTWLGVYE